MRKQPFTREEFNAIYSKVPRLCVDLFIKNDAGEVFMTLRATEPYKNMWHLPGGTVLYDESVKEAVMRIAKEELDNKISIESFEGFIEFIGQSKIGVKSHSVSMVFMCRLNGDWQIDDEASDAKFFRQIPKNTVAEHKAYLKKMYYEET